VTTAFLMNPALGDFEALIQALGKFTPSPLVLSSTMGSNC